MREQCALSPLPVCSHYTCTATWSDPRTLQPLALEHYEWNVLPSGWERYLDEQGDTYYVK